MGKCIKNILVTSLKKVSNNLNLDYYYDNTDNNEIVSELDNYLDLLKL